MDWKLVATLVALLLGWQGVCYVLARGLGRRLRWQPMAVGLALPLAFLAPWCSQSKLLAPCNILRDVPEALRDHPALAALTRPDPYDLLSDVMYQLLPWELEVRHALAERRLPFWSDTVDGGSNIWANPQAGVLSPVDMLARAVPIQHHSLAALALTMLLCFEGTWLLCRQLGRSRIASALAAAAFTLGGGVMAWGLFPISSTLAWTPWLTAGVITLFRRARPRAVATTAVVAAALLVSGHPETAAIGGLFAAICGISLRCRRLPWRRGLFAATLAAALGFGLAAPHVLPFLHVLPGSQRAQETVAEKMPPHSFHLKRPASWFLPRFAHFLLSPTNPHAFGRPYRESFRGPFTWTEAVSGYLGILPFAAVVLAAFAGRDRRAWPFLGFGFAGVLVTARWLPFAYLAYAVPLLRVPAYSRFLAVGSLALAVGAAFGIDRLLARSRQRWPVWVCCAAAAALSLLVQADGWVLALWGAVAAVVLIARRAPRLAGAAAAVLLLVDLVPWSRSLLPTCRPELFYPRTRAIGLLAGEARGAAEGRAVGALQLLFPSLLPVYGVADPRPHNPLAPVSYLEVLDAAFGYAPTTHNYFPRFRNVDHPLLDFLNVRAVLGSIELPPPGTLARIDDGDLGLYQVYRNPDALPRWFLTDRIQPIERGDVARWIRTLSDPRRVAVFRDELGSQPGLDSRGEVRVLSASPGHVVLAVPRRGRKLLATSLPAAPGWRASGNGGAYPITTVNGAFVGVLLPAGEERVELRFRPPGLIAGTIAALLAAAAAAALAISSGGRRRQP